MNFAPVSLIHNRANPVTRDVRRVQLDHVAEVSDGDPGDPARGSAGHLTRRAVVKTVCPDGRVVVPHWVAGAEAEHWNYWRREALAYKNGVTDAFSEGGLRSPELLEQVDLSDGSIELWLEDVEGRTGHDLELEDHLRMAQSLGRAQAKLSSSRSSARNAHSLSSLPFLSTGWMRSYALSRPAGPGIHDDPGAWEHPVVVEGFGESRHRLRVRFGELYRQAPAWFDLLESLPRTLCHLDYWPNNVIAAGGSGNSDDVLLDWAFVGDGAVGEDPGNWVPDTFFDHFLEPGRFEELDSGIWQAYSDGLEASGWGWPLELARLGMCASAVKYVWLPGLMVSNADHAGPTGYGGQPGYELAEVFRRRAVVFEHLLDWLDEAVTLASELGLDFDPRRRG